jgi:hypothetical protein
VALSSSMIMSLTTTINNSLPISSLCEGKTEDSHAVNKNSLHIHPFIFYGAVKAIVHVDREIEV